jgi:hypothetical protein
MPIGKRKDDGSLRQLWPEEEAIYVREQAALRHAGMDARVLKAALTRLTNAEKDFARRDKDYQRERTKRLLKIGKLKATVRRLTGQANGVSGMIMSTKICQNPECRKSYEPTGRRQNYCCVKCRKAATDTYETRRHNTSADRPRVKLGRSHTSRHRQSNRIKPNRPASFGARRTRSAPRCPFLSSRSQSRPD